jgi:hypothetical protein
MFDICPGAISFGGSTAGKHVDRAESVGKLQLEADSITYWTG